VTAAGSKLPTAPLSPAATLNFSASVESKAAGAHVKGAGIMTEPGAKFRAGKCI